MVKSKTVLDVDKISERDNESSESSEEKGKVLINLKTTQRVVEQIMIENVVAKNIKRTQLEIDIKKFDKTQLEIDIEKFDNSHLEKGIEKFDKT